MLRSAQLLTFFVLMIVTNFAQAAEKKVIIGFRQGTNLTDQEKNDKIHRAGGRVKRVHRSTNAVVIQLREEEIDVLKKDPDVAYVEEDRLFTIAKPLPTSPVPSTEYVESWGVQHIGADVAASLGNKGAGVKVAILDSGIDYNHPDLKDNYKGGYNFSYDNSDPFDDTRIGHGTHVAGIIAARNNGTGVVGVAPEASIYAVKVLDGGMGGSLSAVLAGIEWSINNKMNIINMSFGMPFDPTTYSPAFEDACHQAYKAGILLVAAAGNKHNSNVDYPAAFDSVIAVAATSASDTLAPFSNFGSKVELTAPGVAIKSTVPGGGYATLDGTSQAAPHVAGVAALLLSEMTNNEHAKRHVVEKIRHRLDRSAHDLGVRGRDDFFGYGLVQALNKHNTKDISKIRSNKCDDDKQ